MGSFGPIHWIIVGIVVLLLFGGRGKLSGMMGDAAKGIKAFKEGLRDEHETPPPAQPAQTLPPVPPEKDTAVR